MLTADRLRHVLAYSEETGDFTWKNPSGPRARVGDRAGSATQGYINISIDGKLYRAHRLAWLYAYGAWPSLYLDHINGCGTDNRLENLREASQSQNMANSKLRSDCASGFKGVTKYRSRWVATIAKSGRKIHLGVFDTPEEAHAMYLNAAKAVHGEFARAA